ncbi:MAG: redox-sensing transcriptional repressor Rex [Clostridia bacterium]|nr:redox-sensing transcriptional repressor Rex [Clostridia bacterium]
MNSVSILTVQRLPSYLHYLKGLAAGNVPTVSATVIAEALGLNDVQVRKDLASVSKGGRPKVGYVTTELIHDIELFLGYHNTNRAILVGVGNLGRALLSYEGFAQYGLHIEAGFDLSPDVCGREVAGKPVLPISEMEGYCRRENIRMAVLTVPAVAAQTVSEQLLSCGIRAIWSFASAHLQVPAGVLVRYENMATSLAILSNHLAETLEPCDGE